MSEATIPAAPAINTNQTLYWNGTDWVGSPTGSTADSFWGRDNGGANANNSYTGTANPTFAHGRAGADTLDGAGGNDVLVGGADSDRLIGGSGGDTIFGGDAVVGGTLGSPTFGSLTDAAADTLIGGTNDDTYILINNADTITENAGEGTDTVLVGGDTLTSYTLAANAENLALLDPTSTTGRAFTGNAENNSITGGAGADTLVGSTGNDTLSGGGSADRLEGGADNDVILGGTGADAILAGSADTVFGEDGNDSISLDGSGGRVDGGADDDLITVATGTTGTAIGGSGTDTIAFGFSGTVTVSGSTVTGPGGLSINASGIELIRLADGSTTAFGDGSFVVCFVAGTRILTARGEKPVESLRPGELVATLSGQGSPLKPVLFLGRRRIGLAGNPHAAELAPVRIRAGALGPNTPHRDLLVSPDHCLFLDGALVPARLLVNGTSIAVETGLAEVTYFHIELPAHDVVLAEGAAAESWLDAGNRAWFENAPTALLRVTATLDAHASEEATPCAPVIQAGPRLAAIRDRIALQATTQHNHSDYLEPDFYLLGKSCGMMRQ